mmetsp:Transcript_10198/g.12609  ORF Transcript_10198/g.12609 Transcript_10198/m.12609 type:complete len:738 (+) Transcript_10198:233-2446(+)|eukprot:CAMPEP_0172498692 /NCGR_PEP_ID=MMETSP1066-20121228/116004_1 /TAXON_ID=671091 /ORGANISM="Coscinodiscus wailesii, Strain CCMP2513" /LENGTH=737 /DNA_ID=CAMNT_0013272077 /DNA_START=226 /DNA_END=2442 /DNA_ORIENTATION=-
MRFRITTSILILLFSSSHNRHVTTVTTTNAFVATPQPRRLALPHNDRPYVVRLRHEPLYETVSRPTTEGDKQSTNNNSDNKQLPVVPPPIISNDNVNKSDGSKQRPSKLRQLKDRMWVRETLEDLTASEFASSLEATTTNASSSRSTSKKPKKRDVDFEKLVTKLNTRVEEMCATIDDDGSSTICTVATTKAHRYGESSPADDDDDDDGEGTKMYCLREGVGMGSVVYTDEQREALLGRIVETRKRLVEAMDGRSESLDTKDLDLVRMKLQDSIIMDAEIASDGNVTAVAPKTVSGSSSSTNNATNATATGGGTSGTGVYETGDPRLYVREDGSIDWDGALQDRAAVKLFGTAVWSRINGMEPDGEQEVVEDEGGKKKVTAKIIETKALKEMKGKLDELRMEYDAMETKHMALLNSAISPGSTIANINLASLSPKLRFEIRSSESALNTKKEALTLFTINYELERIFTYLEGEMGNTQTKGYIPLQDRLNVAEFGLLESQITALNEQLLRGDGGVDKSNNIDPDVLAVVQEQVTDFKRRLGIDYYVTGLTFDAEAIKKYSTELWQKCKTGVGFYVKGCKLLWNDCVFTTKLIGRAVQGYTLKPREVNTVRRTVRDIITFIPVVIILIIPLSPVGHVLVFGAIQRFFPDFFPSCFTERRQNLLQLYESAEYSDITINEAWNEKLIRLSEAIVFLTVEYSKRAVGKLQGVIVGTDTTIEPQQQQPELNGYTNATKDDTN